MADDDPCARILHSATHHFAEFGYDGASVRDIASAAKVNAALINYYFRSKDELYRAVVVQSVQRLAEARVAVLDGLEKKAAGQPIPVEVILAATTGPVFAESMSPHTDRRAYTRFLSRLFTHPGPETVSIIFGGLKDLRERVFELLCRSIPHVPRKEMAWRYLFLSGSVHFTAGQIGYVEVISEGKCDSGDLSQALAHLIASQSAMLSAPATTAQHKKLARQYGKLSPSTQTDASRGVLPALRARPAKRQKAKP
jgi:AcrR family transcriptional regulator